MGCGCSKTPAQVKAAQQQKAQQARQVQRTPQNRETYRRVLEEAAKVKEQKSA